MTTPWLVLLAFVTLLAAACSSGSDNENSCALRTTELSGLAPSCTNGLECGSNKYELDCSASATGNCTCTQNGEPVKTVAYQAAFCPVDFSTADFDAHAAAAKKACGWP